MPVVVRQALIKKKLLVAYRARPKYQQNDYLSWIMGAKRPETQTRRLAQMLVELKVGGRYMSAKWKPRAKAAPAKPKAKRSTTTRRR